MYTYIYVHMSICMYIYICMYISCIYTYTYMYIYTCIYTYIHINLYIFICIYTKADKKRADVLERDAKRPKTLDDADAISAMPEDDMTGIFMYPTFLTGIFYRALLQKRPII